MKTAVLVSVDVGHLAYFFLVETSNFNDRSNELLHTFHLILHFKL